MRHVSQTQATLLMLFSLPSLHPTPTSGRRRREACHAFSSQSSGPMLVSHREKATSFLPALLTCWAGAFHFLGCEGPLCFLAAQVPGAQPLPESERRSESLRALLAVDACSSPIRGRLCFPRRRIFASYLSTRGELFPPRVQHHMQYLVPVSFVCACVSIPSSVEIG